MRYCFGGYELDAAKGQLRYRGEVQPIAPQVLGVIAYLLAHRERTVALHELVEAVWPDVPLTPGAVGRAVGLARRALSREGREVIRSCSPLGYRFVAKVREARG